MLYMLDTNVVIDATNNKKYTKPILSHFLSIPVSDIAVCSIVVAELEYGARHSRNYEQTSKVAMQFISPFEIVPFTQREAKIYGELREQLAKLGTPIGSNDMLIAAVALAHNAVLVTHNTGEFERIRALKVEDWTKEKIGE